MSLVQLQITDFRNIKSARLQLSSGLNLISGLNGSGKTSILEAIYFLGMGRSFRSHLAQRVINNESEQLILFAEIEQAQGNAKLGLRRLRNGEIEVPFEWGKA